MFVKMTTVVWKLLLIFAIYMLHVGNGSPLPDEKIPSMARKAGGGWRRKVIQESTQAPILTAELEDPSANNVEIGVVDSVCKIHRNKYTLNKFV